jgi:hypothetical protein
VNSLSARANIFPFAIHFACTTTQIRQKMNHDKLNKIAPLCGSAALDIFIPTVACPVSCKLILFLSL